MKRSKSDGLLYIFEILARGEVVNKNKMAQKLNVSPKTIYRYVNDINAYFRNENRPLFVKHSRSMDGYILEGKEENYLTKKDVLAISKVLLESRGFVKEEISGLIQKLLSNYTARDKAFIREITSNELENYVPPKHGKKLIQKIWDMSCAIKEQKVLEIGYYKLGKDGKLEKTLSKRFLEPQGILFSEYYFYLLAFIKGKGYEYPTIYRLDRIKEYTILNERFRVEYKDRFKEGEFRNLIQFMQAGKLQTIKFKYKGRSIEAVLDRLPTAEIVATENGEYVIQAKVFGKGIKMWLLSQGASIEVLEPEEFRIEMREIIFEMAEMYK